MTSFRIHLHTLPRPPHVLGHSVCGFIAVTDRVKVLVAGVFWVKSFCAFTRVLFLRAGGLLNVVWHERFSFGRVSVLTARHRGNKSLCSLRRLCPLRVAVRGAEGLLFAPSAPHFAGELRQHPALAPVQVVVHQQELVDVCQATAETTLEIGDFGREAGAWKKQREWGETQCCAQTKWRENIVLGVYFVKDIFCDVFYFLQVCIFWRFLRWFTVSSRMSAFSSLRFRICERKTVYYWNIICRNRF